MKKSILAIAAVSILTGCAGSPIALSKMTTSELQQYDDKALCASYYYMHSDTVKAELKRRNTIKDWARLDAKKIRIGDSEATLVCTKGLANKINKSVGVYGSHKQWIYGIRGRGFSTIHYVYTKNGAVTGWQQ